MAARYEDVVLALRRARLSAQHARTLVAFFAPLVQRLASEGDAADLIAAEVMGRYVFDCNNGGCRL